MTNNYSVNLYKVTDDDGNIIDTILIKYSDRKVAYVGNIVLVSPNNTKRTGFWFLYEEHLFAAYTDNGELVNAFDLRRRQKVEVGKEELYLKASEQSGRCMVRT